MNRTNNEELEFVVNTMPQDGSDQPPLMSEENVLEALTFHRSFPQYSVTPLHKLSELADYLGLGSIYVKDESYRFGLNAFKVLGGSFAMVKYISKRTGIPVSELPYKVLSSKKFKESAGQTTFYSACCKLFPAFGNIDLKVLWHMLFGAFVRIDLQINEHRIAAADWCAAPSFSSYASLKRVKNARSSLRSSSVHSSSGSFPTVSCRRLYEPGLLKSK